MHKGSRATNRLKIVKDITSGNAIQTKGQTVTHEILSEGMQIDEQFQVAVLIDKFPTSWNDFKKELRHKTKEFSMESLITKIRVEEEARKQDSKEDVFVVSKDNNKTSAHLKAKEEVYEDEPQPKPE